MDDKVIAKTIAFDVVCIYFFVGLIINFVILLFSIVKLIYFLAIGKKTRIISFTLLALITYMYTNQSFQIVAFNWGFTVRELFENIKEKSDNDYQ